MQVQSSVNVKLSPEEEMTVSVLAKDLADFTEGAVCMVGKPWIAECDCDECIPFIPVQELRPSLF